MRVSDPGGIAKPHSATLPAVVPQPMLAIPSTCLSPRSPLLPNQLTYTGVEQSRVIVSVGAGDNVGEWSLHKGILTSHSEVFYDAGRMAEATQNEKTTVDIEEADPAAFKFRVQSMYKGTIGDKEEDDLIDIFMKRKLEAFKGDRKSVV